MAAAITSGLPLYVPRWSTAPGGDQVHELLLATERADREAAADRLGERDEIGLDAEVAGGPAVAGGDAGLDLVEDQQRAVLAS